MTLPLDQDTPYERRQRMRARLAELHRDVLAERARMELLAQQAEDRGRLAAALRWEAEVVTLGEIANQLAALEPELDGPEWSVEPDEA